MSSSLRPSLGFLGRVRSATIEILKMSLSALLPWLWAFNPENGTVCHHWSIWDYIKLHIASLQLSSRIFQVSRFSWSEGCWGKMAKGLHLASPSSQAFRKLGEADSNILAQLKPSSSTGSMGSTCMAWAPFPTWPQLHCCCHHTNASWLRSQPLLQFGSAVVEAFVEEEEQHLRPLLLLLPLPHAHVNT